MSHTYEIDIALNREMSEHYRESQPLAQQFWYEADKDTKMLVGEQDILNTAYNNVGYRNQRQLMFNKLLRIRDMISGHQRKNRLQSVCYASQSGPNNTEDQANADYMTDVLSWCKRMDNTYEKISDAFDGTLTCGLNFLQFWMDYREDPLNGKISSCRIPFNAVLTDPYWTQQDLSDCDWIWTRRYLTREQLLSLHPHLTKEHLPNMKQGPATKDGRFPFLAQAWYQYQYDLFYYDEYWKRKYRKVRKLLDRYTGEMVEWHGTREQFRLLRQFNPNVELITTTSPTILYHVVVNDHLIWKEEAPYGLHRYPFVPFLCYHNTEVQNYAWRYMGVVRNCVDSQVELNRRRNRMLDIMDAQIQSGLMVKEDALVNPEDAFEQGPGKILFFKQTANLASDQVQIQPTTWNQGMFEMAQLFDQDIMSIAGATDELFGESANGKDMSGFLSQLRMGASLVSKQPIFDKLNVSQKLCGEIMLDLIQENFSPEHVRSITGKDAPEEFFSREFAKYHISVEEGAMTSTQRQLQFIQAFQLQQAGIPISNKYLLEKSNLQGKKEIMEDIAQQDQQQAEMQQQQAMLELQKLEQEAKQLESVTQANFAAAEERKTRSLSNVGLASSHLSQSMRDESQAALDNAKAIHELNQIPGNRLMELIRFMTEMQAHQKNMQQVDIDNTRAEVEYATRDVQAAKSKGS